MKAHDNVKRAVEQELLWDRGVDARLIKVGLTGGIITLNGSVPNGAQKRTALRAAQRAAPDAVVHDNLVVRCPEGRHCVDTELAGEIRLKIARDAMLRNAAIDVTVTDRRVTLTGMVDSPDQRDEAVALIREFPGIADIDNRVVTRLGKMERAVASSIANALLSASLQPADDIVVDVRDGIVRLTGTCASATQKEAACNAAWNAKGVRWVVDQLQVR
ncbi:BON domain-containing protein [Paraburkholderia rhizosphaerae]|uniref:Osmotically-inducible protein OsmY n=1 Tax=Paraburkholderia rhizosphaerae TaxID=480658 RepID=A0A4R8LWA4_9BURK|nr:BON domain-containing protein [Paraburkholderia rhizosphaerae]TDY50976.1 osmotically-inducible protein OsmY [Paraburkholderia rhizosphaerae]